MRTRNSRRPLQILVSAALAVTMTLPFNVAMMRNAAALSNDVQFNLLGWKNGASWGNDGQIGSVNWMWYMIAVYNNETGSWPFAVTLSEVCKDADDPNFNSQWDLLRWNLATIGMRGGLWVEDNQQWDKLPACWQGGTAAFGVGDTVWGTWPFGEYGQWTQQSSSHLRGFACPHLRISLFNYNYRVCTTHLENNGTTATNQLSEANTQYFYAAQGVPTLYGGDLNLSPQGNPGNPAVGTWIFDTNHFEAGYNLYPTYPNPGPNKKIDYSAYSTPWFHTLSSETTIAPGTQTCFCSGNGHPYSDHLLLRVYIST